MSTSTDKFNQVHEELLHFLLPYHKILCEENLWPKDSNFTSPNISLQLIKDISSNKNLFQFKLTNRSDILKYLMFIYTLISFLYVFAYCSLQTAIRHVENAIVQNMKNVCIDQECGKPLFDLLTKTHQKFENILHPKILHIKNVFIEFFNQRRQFIGANKQLPEPKVENQSDRRFFKCLRSFFFSFNMNHSIYYTISNVVFARLLNFVHQSTRNQRILLEKNFKICKSLQIV